MQGNQYVNPQNCHKHQLRTTALNLNVLLQFYNNIHLSFSPSLLVSPSLLPSQTLMSGCIGLCLPSVHTIWACFSSCSCLGMFSNFRLKQKLPCPTLSALFAVAVSTDICLRLFQWNLYWVSLGFQLILFCRTNFCCYCYKCHILTISVSEKSVSGWRGLFSHLLFYFHIKWKV